MGREVVSLRYYVFYNLLVTVYAETVAGGKKRSFHVMLGHYFQDIVRSVEIFEVSVVIGAVMSGKHQINVFFRRIYFVCNPILVGYEFEGLFRLAAAGSPH